MKALFLEIKEWKYSWPQYLLFSWILTLWLCQQRLRRLKQWVVKYFDWLLRASFLITGTAGGVVLYYFGSFSFEVETLSNYLVSIGAMTGGVIAIVFTISIFLLQNAANLYSSQYLDVYIHDWKEKIVYLCIVSITILFFTAGLFIGGLTSITETTGKVVVVGTLFLIGLVFALIDWQYKAVRTKISPTETIAFLEKKGLRHIKEIHSHAVNTSRVLAARNPDLTKDEALASAYNNFYQPAIASLNRQIENLVEISLRLSDNQEVETVKRGLNAVLRLLHEYLESRKTSSIAMPSGIAFLATESDSQRFLYNNLDRLNKAGEKFINDGKDELATHVLNIYEPLIKKSGEMSFVGSSHNENPVLDAVLGSFKQYIDIGIKTNNLEVVFQSIDKLGRAGVVCVNEGYNATLSGIEEKLLEVARHGILTKQTIITDKCNTNYLYLFFAIFAGKKIIRRHHSDSIFKHISYISSWLLMSVKSGHIKGGLTSAFSLAKGYDELYQYIVRIINIYGTLTDEREKQSFRGDFVDIFNELYSSLRSLTKDLKDCDNKVTESIGRLLQNVNDLIINLIQDADFADQKEELEKHLSWNLHLPYWFADETDKFDCGSNNFRSLVEGSARAGVLSATELQSEELTRSAISSLKSLTKAALEKSTDRYGFGEPRIMKKLCFLAVLAVKNKWHRTFAEALVAIWDFEKKYKAKYFSNVPSHIDPYMLSPSPDQLKKEVYMWRYDFDYKRLNRQSLLMDDAVNLMYSRVTIEDIDWFTFKVWQEWDASSPANDAIEKAAAEHFEKKKLHNARIGLVTVLDCVVQKKYDEI